MVKRDQQIGISFPDADGEPTNGSVECLGMTFENDQARREYFLEKLRERLQDSEFRKIEGFPIGEDEDILAMSDPPYYTACPNPFLEDFLRHHGPRYDPSISYHREPFAVDVSEGKTHAIYKAHAYYTKVPHLAIIPSILHYTQPGDTILDGFCGSGMTGVAAQWCNNPPPDVKQSVREQASLTHGESLRWGERNVILNDLSPFASFMAANYLLGVDAEDFQNSANRLLDELKAELGWMYETKHSDGRHTGTIEYTVWSEMYLCPECSGEVVFLEVALDFDTKRVLDRFSCPHCGVELSKRSMQRLDVNCFDRGLGTVGPTPRRVPVIIAYKYGGSRFEKTPDKSDLSLLERIDELPLPPEIPIKEYPFPEMWEAPRLLQRHITSVHQLFLPRAAHALCYMWRKAKEQPDRRLRQFLLFFVEQSIRNMSIMNSYEPLAFSQNARGQKSAYYVPSQHAEVAPWYFCTGKIKTLKKAFSFYAERNRRAFISTGSAGHLLVPDSSIDYIFTDPPFGDNFAYAELNFLIESWHRVQTDMKPEAVVERTKRKRESQKLLHDYQELMEHCFNEYCRVLKPGRWMTVVFHNSKNAVWNAIQEALQRAGFVVADVRTLDKKQRSFKQITSIAVKQDLIISAYKPNGGLESRFEISKGTEEGVWDFVKTHLMQLPVFVGKGNKCEPVAERQAYLLFDRMVAFHVQRGVAVPISVAEFNIGLAQKFPERDGMYFLPEQVPEYERRRLTVSEIEQLELFVTDEVSSIQWCKRELSKRPQSFQELQPQFMREVAGWEKHEKPLELGDLLEQNFLCYDGKGEVPSQIHSYVSSNFHELRNLDKDDPKLIAKARNRWYVPDPRKEVDLEKIRHRALMKEFHEYVESKGKLKVVRTEALRAGFKECWQSGDYKTIVGMAKRVKDDIIQEDPALLMYYDNALMRAEG